MNNETIKRSDAINAIKALHNVLGDAGTKAAVMALEGVPAADAVEVVNGKWVDHMVRDWRCSECGEKINKLRNVDGYCYDDKPNYCPNCGARMDGE